MADIGAVIEMEELSRTKLLLSNCAFWAMNALGVEGSPRHIEEIQRISLRNILDVSKEFVVYEPGTDCVAIYEGIRATLFPEEGWPEPKVEWM